MKLNTKKKNESENYYSVLEDDIPIENDDSIVIPIKLDMNNEEMTIELNLLKQRLVLEEVRTAEVEKHLENARKENQHMKKNMKTMNEKVDIEQTNVKVLEELLKGIYDDYTTKCGEVEDSKRTINDLQNEKRNVLAAKNATEAALHGYQEALDENYNLMNKNKELLRKVSILECKMNEEESIDKWKIVKTVDKKMQSRPPSTSSLNVAKNKQSEQGRSKTMGWIEKGMNEKEKQNMRRYVSKAMGNKEERRYQSRYKGK